MSNNQIATVAGGGIGAGAGFLIGGPAGASLGFSIGASLGSALVPEQLPDQVGGQLQDLEVTSSAFGQPIPLIWGTNRVAGKLIFSSGKKETRIETDVGGKGGPEQTQVSYTYSMDAAYSLGQLPPSATGFDVRRIWINSKLVYDVGDAASAVSLEKSTKLAAAVTVYDGAETQEPSSLQEAYEGVGNVPAYRGQGLLEFEALQLGQFSNGTISVTAEVVVNPAATTVPITINAWAGQNAQSAAYDNGTILTARVENIAPTSIDTWEHVVRRYDLFGNILTEQRKLIDVGTFPSGTPDPRLTWNDPMMVASHGGSNDKFRLSKFDAPQPNGFSARQNHPYNSVWNEGAWNLPNTNRVWLRWGDYFYVAGGNYAGGVRSLPNYIGRFPVITDITSPQYGYPQLDADISVNYGNTYGQDIDWITIDRSNQRIYITGHTTTVWHMASWDLDLNLIAEWHEPGVSIPSSLQGMPHFKGNRIMTKAIVASTQEVYALSFDPDISNSTFAVVGTKSITGGVAWNHMLQLTESLSLSPKWILSIDPLVAQQTVQVSTIISDMLTLVGADPGDFDVSSITDTVDAYRAGELISARRGIEPIMRAFFIDAAEVDNKIVFTKRGGASVRSIPDDDLVRVSGALITKNRGSELELPKRVTFSYINQVADYQVNEQHADRQVAVGSVGISNVSIPVVIDDDTAAQITDALLYSTWAERERITAHVSTKNLDIVPTDVITLGDAGLRVRIQEVDTKLIGSIKIKGVIDYADSYASTRIGGAATASSTMAGLEGPTIPHLLDIPIMRPADEGVIKYYGASGVLDGWGGAVLYKSTDSGKTYQNRTQALNNTVFGFTNGTLANPSSGDTYSWDYNTTINIRVSNGSLSSASELEVLNGANVAALGTDGRWEIIQWQTATLEGNGTYTLSTLLRGRRGTEHNTANHEDGDEFVILSESALVRINDEDADIDQAYLYKSVTIGGKLQETTGQVFTNTGISKKPFSPTHIRGSRDVSNNLTTTFLRRSRLAYNANYILPLGEDTQAYELEYWNSIGTVQYGGTKTATTQTHSYTNAQQTTDGATPGQLFLVKIYQISALIGRGYEGSEII